MARFITLFSAFLAATVAAPQGHAAGNDGATFVRTPLMYVAALGDPTARRGVGAEHWGIWRVDPGPRGVRLDDHDELADGVAPHDWRFDHDDWWLEENGLIMESPAFPLPAGKYVVTGDRDVVTVLTVHAMDESGVARWELDEGATLHDVTHLGCRSARYTPVSDGNACSPANAPRSAFRVAPGAAMPPVAGCKKQDYHVLFIVGVGAENASAVLR